MRRTAIILSLVGLGATGRALSQAPPALTLTSALERARSHHPGLIQPRADRAFASAMLLGSRAAYLPKVAAEWGVVRSDDPVAVFGSKLRQGIFAGPDLALEALNHPRPVTNTSIGLTIEQPVVAPEGWHARRAATSAVRAAQHAEARAGQVAALDVVQLYFGAQLARERIIVLADAREAADETLTRVLVLRREGVVTVVDEQLARSRVSELEAAAAAATAASRAALDQLLIVIGERPGQDLALDDKLERSGGDTAAAGTRADLQALEYGVAAARADVDRARSQLLPTVGAFGTVGLNQGSLGAFSGPTHWTAGLIVRWTPFRGFADRAQVLRAHAAQDAAEQALEARRRSADAELNAATADKAAATAAVAAADLALGTAAQASRVATTRYQAGVGTIAEVLAVRAAESSQRLMKLDALYRARLAEARMALAQGATPQ